MRINQYLAFSGLGSRRKVESYLVNEQVTINNKIAQIFDQVDPKVDQVRLDGQLLTLPQPVLYGFHKPTDVVSSLIRQRNEKSLADFIPKSLPRLFPIGRLDKKSSGLMLLTNDGDLALKLTHPRYFHEKEYEVKVQGPSPSSRLSRLSHLSRLDQVKLAPFKIEGIYIQGTQAKFNLTLTQGLNHQIRRMCDKVGLTVKEIKRVRIDKYRLDNLKVGEIKKISLEKDEFGKS